MGLVGCGDVVCRAAPLLLFVGANLARHLLASVYQDGYITMDELRAALGDDEEMIKKYVSEFDRDNDGRIDYEEFMRMVLPKDLRIRIARY